MPRALQREDQASRTDDSSLSSNRYDAGNDGVLSASLSLSCIAVLRSISAGLQASSSPPPWPPVCPLPADSPLRAAFASAGMHITADYCFAQKYEGEARSWPAANVTALCKAMSHGSAGSGYGAAADKAVRHGLAALAAAAYWPLAGSSGGVIGSESPWVECLALAEGAADVTTLEYAEILVDHPRIFAARPADFATDLLADRRTPLDWLVSFSSLEHSGLGRYGDVLDVDGDAHALALAHCALRPGGLLLLGVPMTCENAGAVHFNAHRIFGWTRLAHIARDFEVVAFVGPCLGYDTSGSVVLLRKPSEGSPSRAATAADFARAADVALAAVSAPSAAVV